MPGQLHLDALRVALESNKRVFLGHRRSDGLLFALYDSWV